MITRDNTGKSNMRKNLLSLILSLILFGQLQALEVQDVQLHLKITGMTEAKAPEIWRDYLVLTYKPEKTDKIYWSCLFK